MVGQQRTFSILDALKQLFLHFRSLLENLLKASLRKIIKTLFKTLLAPRYFWCFVSFSDRTFCFKRWKFSTSRHYFDPCFFFINWDHLNKVRKKLKNVIKSDSIKNDNEFKTYNKKIKAKNQRYRNMKIKTQKEISLVFQKNTIVHEHMSHI